MPSVCSHCIEERWLASYVTDNASENECDYCDRKSTRPIAVPLHELTPHIQERIECLYEDPANSVSYETAEGGYLLPTMDSYDVLEDVGLGVDNTDLLQDLVDTLPQSQWIERDPYGLTEEDALRVSWEEFARLVKHRVRYLLFPLENDSDSDVVRPGDMLATLAELFASHGLFSALEVGTKLLRTRVHDPGAPPGNTVEDLGPPPADRARFSNRMSPAGMSMFYAALDEETARAETYVRYDGQPTEITLATFELVERVNVLDLTTLPEVPSVFASDQANLERPPIAFLHDFVSDLTQRVEKDGREHVDYVPSQIVTEYVRYQVTNDAGEPLKGIIYPSARQTGGGWLCVVRRA